MFGSEVQRAALAHAAAEAPRESCGLVVGGVYLPRKNIAADPLHDFKISPQGYAGALTRGVLQAVIHSHPDGPDYPSEDDMSHQRTSALPWGVVYKSKGLFWFGDQCPIPDLLGRQFRTGVTDCYSLVRDWYRL